MANPMRARDPKNDVRNGTLTPGHFKMSMATISFGLLLGASLGFGRRCSRATRRAARERLHEP
jgi:hypothetical protein